MAKLVCGRWSKWIVLALWLVVLAVAGPMAGKLTAVQKNDNSAWLPGGAEATQVMELQGRFQPDDIAPAVIVFERRGGLTGADKQRIEDTVAKLKKGQNLYVQAYNMAQNVMTLSLPLGDFAKAYDGPPTDPKQFEENQKKLQEELQKKAEETRKKLEGAGGANPATK